MGQPAAPIETFARFQLPAIIDSFMLAAAWLAGWLFASGMGQPAAFIETIARFQLPAIID
jgi:hypothetical protein